MSAPAWETPRETPAPPQPVPPDTGKRPPVEEPPKSPGDSAGVPPQGDPRPNEPPHLVR